MEYNNNHICDESVDQLNDEYKISEETVLDFEDLPMMQSFYGEA